MNDTHRKARLNHLIATDYGKPADFARATGLSKARVSQIAGDAEPFGEAAARKLAQDLGLNEDWFNINEKTPKESAVAARSTAAQSPYGETWGSFGAAEKRPAYEPNEIGAIDDNAGTPAPISTEQYPHSFERGGDVTITQYDVAAGMGNSRALDNDHPGVIKLWRVERKWVDTNIPNYSSIANLAIVTGFGPSMRPMFNPGDPLLIDRGVKTINHEGVFFFRVGDDGYIKILQRIPAFDGPGFTLRVISKNPDYPPYDLNPKNPHFEVLGKVLTVWRSEHY